MNFSLEAIEVQLASEIKVDANGKGWASIRGAARLAGVADSSLVRGFQGAALKPSQLATFLIGQGFDGAALEQFSETGIPDLAVTSILEYYAFEADRYCTELSLLFYRATARIGVRVWMQKVKNWEPEPPIDYQTAIKLLIEQQMPALATDYKPRFTPEFWQQLERVYGLKKGQLACASFIKWRIYRHFPKEVCDRLEAINPLLENGYRASKFHQHFTDSLLVMLQARINQVTDCLSFSDSKKHFKRKIKTTRRIVFDSDVSKMLKGGE